MPNSGKKPLIKQRRIPQKPSALAKYNGVIEACSRVLAEKDYDRITMTDIVLESGLPYATVYQYFGGKEDVMLAWINSLIDVAYAQLINQKRTIKEEQIESYAANLIKSSLTLVALNKAMIRNLLDAMPSGFTSRLMATLERRALQMVNTLLLEQITDIQLSDPEFTTRILTRLLQGYIHQTILDDDSGKSNPEREANELAKVVYTYLHSESVNTSVPQETP